MSDATKKQIASYNVMREHLLEAKLLALFNKLPLPLALTNPQPVLPEHHGEYHDARGYLWWLDSGGWHDKHGSWMDHQARGFGPFTRLTPERPPVLPEQIDAIADESRSWDETVLGILALVNGQRA